MKKANIKYWNGSSWTEAMFHTNSDLVVDQNYKSKTLTQTLQDIESGMAYRHGEANKFTTQQIKALDDKLSEQIKNLNQTVANIGLYEIVTILPTSGIKTNKIYLLKDSTAAEDSENKYSEYAYIDGTWELMGSTTLEEVGGSAVTSRFNIENGTGLGSIQQKAWVIEQEGQDPIPKNGGSAIGPNTVAFNKDTFAYQMSSAAFGGGGNQAGMTEDDFNAAYTFEVNGTRYPKALSKHNHDSITNNSVYVYTSHNGYYANFKSPTDIIVTTLSNLEGKPVVETRQGFPYNLSWGFATATGEVNKALGRGSFAANYSNVVWAQFASAFGETNTVTDKAKCGFATGQSTILDAPYTFVANMGNKVYGASGSAFGYNNTVYSDSGFSTGQENIVNENATAGSVFGYHNVVAINNQQIVGQYNRYGKLNGAWDLVQDGDKPEKTSKAWIKRVDANGNTTTETVTIFDESTPDDIGDTNTQFGVAAGATLNGARHTAFRVLKDSTMEHRIVYGKNSGGNIIRKKVFKTDTTGHIKIYEKATEALHPIRKKEFDSYLDTLKKNYLVGVSLGFNADKTKLILNKETPHYGISKVKEINLEDFTYKKADIETIKTNAATAYNTAQDLNTSVEQNTVNIATNASNISALTEEQKSLRTLVENLGNIGGSGGGTVNLSGSDIAGIISINANHFSRFPSTDNGVTTYTLALSSRYANYLDRQLYDKPVISNFKVLSQNTFAVGESVAVTSIASYNVSNSGNINGTLTLSRDADNDLYSPTTAFSYSGLSSSNSVDIVILQDYQETLIAKKEGSVSYTLKGKNTLGNDVSSSWTMHFKYPLYYGVGNNVTYYESLDISTDTTKTFEIDYTVPGNQGESSKIVFLFPRQIKTILSGTFTVDITEPTRTNVTLDNNGTITASYYKYETTEKIDAGESLTFSITLKEN